jgi:hypothetical protein
MLFSEHFGLTRRSRDDWFDAILDADTELFVDPLLIYKDPARQWAGVHDELIAHFDRCFELIARSARNPQSPYYRRALGMLQFAEPFEFGLGYASGSTYGSGGGVGYARDIAKAMQYAINRGLRHLDHFEVLGVLNEGIGPDRISDLTLTILKSRFIEYTQAVAARHGLTLDEHEVWAGTRDQTTGLYDWCAARLPTNPVTEGPVLLVPERFLRRLPTLEADDWWSHFARDNVNIDIMESVNKKKIVSEARKHLDSVLDWAAQVAREDAEPYDLASDPVGVWQWDHQSQKFAVSNPLRFAQPRTASGFASVIETVIGQFRLWIEEEGGWRLLWNDDGTDKPEAAAQNLFRGTAKHYCYANDVSLDAEVNLGRGPVDFIFSRGRTFRAHLEVKKLHNGTFWNGLRDQLPSYMRSDEVTDGWLMALQYRDGGVSRERARKLPAEVKAVAKAEQLTLRFALIDAREKLSASKIRS